MRKIGNNIRGHTADEPGITLNSTRNDGQRCRISSKADVRTTVAVRESSSFIPELERQGLRFAVLSLEGIVAKRKSDPHLPERATWLEIRNYDDSQWVGREELFERERGSGPDFQVWGECVLVCEPVCSRETIRCGRPRGRASVSYTCLGWSRCTARCGATSRALCCALHSPSYVAS